MQNNRNIISTLQNISLVVVYLFIIGLVFIGGWYLLNTLFLIPGGFLALYVIIFLLGGGLLGAWLWVLIKLPSGLARAFDPIKNKIASREIKSTEDFSVEIGKFMVDYFSFFRFDVVAVQVGIKGRKATVFPASFIQIGPDENELQTKSQATEEIFYNGVSTINDRKYHTYIIPIWFGKEWLGYICVFSDTRLNKIKLNFLNEFEELYVDDQLMHVLYYKSLELNRLSNVNEVS